MTLLSIDDLHRLDPQTDKPILRGITVNVAVGDRIGLVGPTGSGKSSLMRCVALLDRCDQGQIRYRGEAVSGNEVPGYRRRVLYLMQNPAFAPGTIEQNLRRAFTFAASQDTFDLELARNYVDRLHLEPEFISKSVELLSGGERQLVALIRALLLSPEVILFDEPTAALDRATTDRFEDLVATWYSHSENAAEDRAYLWTSHDASQVERMTDRIVKMESGTIVT